MLVINSARRVDMPMRRCIRELPQDSTMVGEKDITSLLLAVRTVSGKIKIEVFYDIMGKDDFHAHADAVADADADAKDNGDAIAKANADPIAVDVLSIIGCRFEMPKDSLSSSYMAGNWLGLFTRKSGNCIRDIWPRCKCYVPL